MSEDREEVKILNVLIFKLPKVCKGDLDDNAVWWLAELQDKGLAMNIKWNVHEGCFEFLDSKPKEKADEQSKNKQKNHAGDRAAVRLVPGEKPDAAGPAATLPAGRV